MTELKETVGSVPAEISWVFMKGMTEGNHKVGNTSGVEATMDFLDNKLGILRVLKDRIAFHASEPVTPERQVFRRTNNIDTGNTK
jgi:hypothetical protein